MPVRGVVDVIWTAMFVFTVALIVNFTAPSSKEEEIKIVIFCNHSAAILKHVSSIDFFS